VYRNLLKTGIVVFLLGCGSSKSSSGDGGGTGGSNPTGTGGAIGTGGATGGSTGTGGANATGGSKGTGGSPAATGGSSGSADQSVLERNKHPSRDGIFLQPTLTKAAAATMAADTGFKATFTGAMWASPLYLQNGPNGKGIFIAATTGNDVFALDETTGAQVWTYNLGSSPTMNQPSGSSPTCGNIHPLGIISTPVIDGTTTPPTLYVAGAVGTSSIMSHQIVALSTKDGTKISGWPIDVSSSKSGNVIFATTFENQRSALSLVGKTLYVAYGGHIGDCGGYHGWVMGIDTQDPTMRGAWATAGQGEGIWGAAGMASDGNGVFALTGNNTARVSTHADSEEAVRITGLGTLSDSFYPSSWQTMDSGDADLGASNPVYVELPGATPSKMLAVVSKDGHLYLLDAAALGGKGGQKVDFMVANGTMAIHTAVAAYKTAAGLYVTFGTDSGAACPGGGNKNIMSVLIAPGSPPKPSVAWCAPLAGAVTGPISTTTDGTNNVIVWYMNNGKLNGVDGDTGAAVFTSTNSCSGVRQWTSPIAVNGRIVVGGDGNLCSWSAH
jgi:hypothetical protein